MSDSSQVFELKLIEGNGDITFIKRIFPEGSDIYDMEDLFRNFLKATTYSESTINSIFKEEDE